MAAGCLVNGMMGRRGWMAWAGILVGGRHSGQRGVQGQLLDRPWICRGVSSAAASTCSRSRKRLRAGWQAALGKATEFSCDGKAAVCWRQGSRVKLEGQGAHTQNAETPTAILLPDGCHRTQVHLQPAAVRPLQGPRAHLGHGGPHRVLLRDVPAAEGCCRGGRGSWQGGGGGAYPRASGSDGCRTSRSCVCEPLRAGRPGGWRPCARQGAGGCVEGGGCHLSTCRSWLDRQGFLLEHVGMPRDIEARLG